MAHRSLTLLLRGLVLRGLAGSIAAACLVIGAPSLVLAQRAEARDAMRTLLSGVEDAPTETDLRALGDEALPALIALFDDASEPAHVRLRTLWAARYFPTDASRTFLTRVARDVRHPGLWVRAAIQSLAHAFGASATAVIAPHLRHADPVVREAAILALGRIGNDEARALLTARRGHETELSAVLERTLAGTER